ncbi:hypothetical protein C8J56DRAFT_973077 [Mycena floridula]|nr:hypothetical protein C8J56DRAFT_973077 [Mycena floridula]
MLLPAFFRLALAFTSVVALPAAVNHIQRATDAISFTPVGSVSAYQEPTVQTTIINYQKPDGSIWQYTVSGPLFKGTILQDFLVVPAGEALCGTPIAAVWTPNVDVHLYFLSPSLIVSEYIYIYGSSGYIGGSACPQCITNNGFLAASSQFLYAMEDSGAPVANLRVGFDSAGTPGGLTEASRTNAEGWSLSVLV